MVDLCFRLKFTAHTHITQTIPIKWHLYLIYTSRCNANNFHRPLFKLQIIFKYVENYTTLPKTVTSSINDLSTGAAKIRHKLVTTTATAAKMQYWWTTKILQKNEQSISWVKTSNWKVRKKSWAIKKNVRKLPGIFFLSI